MIQVLYCEIGSHWWMRTALPGRKPRACPLHYDLNARRRLWRSQNMQHVRRRQRHYYRQTVKTQGSYPYASWRTKQPERAAAAHRDYMREIGHARRRALKLGCFVEDVDRRTVYEINGGMCGICEQFIEGPFHVHHVKPLTKGGVHGYVNVVPAHPLCNVKLGNRVG